MCLSMNDKCSTKLKTKQKLNHDPVFIFNHNNIISSLRPEVAKQRGKNSLFAEPQRSCVHHTSCFMWYIKYAIQSKCAIGLIALVLEFVRSYVHLFNNSIWMRDGFDFDFHLFATLKCLYGMLQRNSIQCQRDL